MKTFLGFLFLGVLILTGLAFAERVTLDSSAQVSGAYMHSNTNATNTATAVANVACVVEHLHFYNNNAVVTYLQLYNATAACVTVGTTVPAQSYGCAANASLTADFPKAKGFGTALSYAVTTTPGGGAAPATNNVTVSLDYKK